MRALPVSENSRPEVTVARDVELGDCSISSVQCDSHAPANASCTPDVIEFRLASGRRHWIIRVRRRALEEHLMRKLGYELPRRLAFTAEAQYRLASTAAMKLASHVCDVSVMAPSVLARAEVRAQYSRTLMELVLYSMTHNYSDSLHGALASSAPPPPHRVQKYIDTHIADIRTVGDVALALGVSTRTVQLWFRRVLEVCPAEYIRRVRLTALHRALLEADASCSVADLMASVGIVSCGRYAEYYRRVFGESPSSSLARAIGRERVANRRVETNTMDFAI